VGAISQRSGKAPGAVTDRSHAERYGAVEHLNLLDRHVVGNRPRKGHRSVVGNTVALYARVGKRHCSEPDSWRRRVNLDRLAGGSICSVAGPVGGGRIELVVGALRQGGGQGPSVTNNGCWPQRSLAVEHLDLRDGNVIGHRAR